MHKKIKEKLLHGIEIAESKTIGEYWEDIKEIVISLDLNEQNDVEDFGIMFEVFNPDDFWECYFTIQVALQENGEYSHMEHIFLSCRIPLEYGPKLESSSEDLWIGNEETLFNIFSLVESNEYFKIIRDLKSDKTTIDSTEV